MDAYNDQVEGLSELDSRHDELLRRLEELDARVEQVLAQWLAERQEPTARR
ncbi:MAG: hypothetical protein ABSF26_23920 [Thermoguttaceae bacterium]|jgi:hypothetical protein